MSERTWREAVQDLSKEDLIKLVTHCLTQQIDALGTDGDVGYRPPNWYEDGSPETFFCQHSGDDILRCH